VATIVHRQVLTLNNCSMWRQTAVKSKTGSLSRSDRLAKYNQLLRIEQLLGKNAAESKPVKGRVGALRRRDVAALGPTIKFKPRKSGNWLPGVSIVTLSLGSKDSRF